MSAEQSDALVFFGATGDLAYKKIFPSRRPGASWTRSWARISPCTSTRLERGPAEADALVHGGWHAPEPR